MGETQRLEQIDASDEALYPWADALRWMVVVPVALLPLLIALVFLMIVKVILAALGVPMVAFAYMLAAGASAYLSVKWSAGIAPHRGWGVGRVLSITYLVISLAALVAVTVLDHHPSQAVPENETPDLIQILAFAGLGLGALAGYIWIAASRQARSHVAARFLARWRS